MLFIYIVILFINCFLGYLVLKANRKDVAHISFFLTILGLSFWILSNYLVWNSQNPLIWARLSLIGTNLFATSILFFLLYYPKQIINLNIFKFITILTPFIIFLIFTPTKFIILNIINGIQYYAFGYTLFYVYLIIYIVLTLFLCLRGLIIYKDEQRKKLLFFTISLLVSTLCISITSMLLPMLGLSKYLALGPLFASIFIFSVSYSLLKYRLLNIYLILGENMATGLLILINITFYITFFWLYNNYIPYKSNILFLSITILYFSICSITFNFLKNKLITGTKHAFIPGYYDIDKLLNSISDSLNSEISRKEIFKIIETNLDSALKFDRIGFIVAQRDKAKNLQKYIFFEKENADRSDYVEQDINIDNPLIKFCSSQMRPCAYSALNKKSMEILLELGYKSSSVLLPFHSPEILEGVLLLGERSGKVAYKQRDFDCFNRLIKSINSLLYSLTPYEKLEKLYEADKEKLYKAQLQLIRAENNISLARTIQECHHEIRTPVTVIKSSLDLLPKNPSIEDLNEFITDVKSQADRMLYVINTTLDLASTKEKHKKALNFNDIIEETVKLLPPSGYLLSKKLGNIPNIVGVKEDLIGVLINLINNAKRAMPDGGTLTLKTRFDENTNTVIAQISDTGIGIPSKNLESIWKPYFTTDKTDGHGLGLSIAQKTIQEHQGLIQVESEQGKGTTFILKFPITA